jgi:hypothetical protein
MSTSAVHLEAEIGMFPVIDSTTDDWSTTYGLQTLVPAPDIWSNGTKAYYSHTRMSWPRCFVEYSGKLYATACVDQLEYGGGNDYTGLGLFARECHDDGSLGNLILCAPDAYVGVVGASLGNYVKDATLGDALTALCLFNGCWGGSTPNRAPSPWVVGWANDPNPVPQGTGGVALLGCEPITYWKSSLNGFRIWRPVNDVYPHWWWSQKTIDGGASWGNFVQTNLPNASSAGDGLVLPDGRFLLVSNPRDYTSPTNNQRDPLLLALFDRRSGVIVGCYAVWQGVSQVALWPSASKGGGCQYPGVHFDGTTIRIVADRAREDVLAAKILLSSLTTSGL